jgi:ferric-dicitrate binding protein FerR (iron transport regulator)
MKDFRLFDITDFVMDEDFIRWVYKSAEKDNLFWNNWLKQNPDKHLLVSEARRVLESVKMEERRIGATDIQSETDRLLQTIRQQPAAPTAPASVSAQTDLLPVQPATQQERPRRIIMVRPGRWWFAAAAILLIAIGIKYMWPAQHIQPARFSYHTLTLNRHLVEHTNTSDKPVTITLRDGTLVELSTNGRLSYASDFDSAGTRDVYLSGQAFFKVAKNPRRPFRVFANEIVTKVLGTSFMVRAYENDTTIQVIVRTGKVSVYSQAAATAAQTSTPAELGGYILTPNQQLVYEKVGQKFQKVLLEEPELIATGPKASGRIYEDTPLETVFSELIKDYGINIVYDAELLKKCTVTADLSNETFYRRLDLICRAVGARYQVMDGQVVIQSNGCE